LLLKLLLLFQDTLKPLSDSLADVESPITYQDLWGLAQKIGITILIGALIGLEREFARPKDEKIFAGIRTFPLIAILGFISALVSSITSFWIFVAVFISFSSILTVSYIYEAQKGKPGGTSEVANLLVFILGSLVFWDFVVLAAVVAVITAAFLSFKIQLHTFVGKISNQDIYATIKFAIITVIVLPLLPDETYGPFDVLNPRLIWLMVVLVSGISFIGYILIKFIGMGKGVALTGLLGGIISSTAVTVSFSRKSKINPHLSADLAGGIILATTIMFPRLFIIILIMNSSLIPFIWQPFLIFTALTLAAGFFIMRKKMTKREQDFELRNPFELKPALLFGLAFAVILFLSKAAQEYFGSAGIYAASAAGGLTSVDAIVISIAELSHNTLTETVAVAAIIISVITNTIFKIAIAAFYGTAQLKIFLLKGLGIIAAGLIVYLTAFLLLI
jgi:uncharacterized membrane protein (DUF4010 family)